MTRVVLKSLHLANLMKDDCRTSRCNLRRKGNWDAGVLSPLSSSLIPDTAATDVFRNVLEAVVAVGVLIVMGAAFVVVVMLMPQRHVKSDPAHRVDLLFVALVAAASKYRRN